MTLLYVYLLVSSAGVLLAPPLTDISSPLLRRSALVLMLPTYVMMLCALWVAFVIHHLCAGSTEVFEVKAEILDLPENIALAWRGQPAGDKLDD